MKSLGVNKLAYIVYATRDGAHLLDGIIVWPIDRGLTISEGTIKFKYPIFEDYYIMFMPIERREALLEAVDGLP